MFNVGDIVVGTPESDKVYNITNSKARLRVVKILSLESMVVALVNEESPFDRCCWTVECKYFRLERLEQDHIYYNEKENKLSYQKLNNDYKEII